MALDRLQLQFSTTGAWQSGLIRLATRSEFSHVDMVVPPGLAGLDALTPKPYGLLGASDPGGVMIRPPNYHAFLKRKRLTLVTDKAEAIIRRWATQVGKPFDDQALQRTFDLNWGDEWRDPDKWYCAEGVDWALLEEGFFDGRPFPVVVRLNHVTPEDIINQLAGEFDPAEFAKEYTGP